MSLQLVRIVEQFIASDKLQVPSRFHQDALRKRILISLNIDRIVQHLDRHLSEVNREHIEPVFDEDFPIGSTRSMRTWYTTKLCQPAQKSQISHLVVDGGWEAHAANVLESSTHVTAYAKNDHLGFQVHYMWNGSMRRYIPDFLVRLANGKMLVLEIKGQDSNQNKAKRSALDTWVEGVNTKGGCGTWCWDVAFDMSRIQDILDKHAH